MLYDERQPDMTAVSDSARMRSHAQSKFLIGDIATSWVNAIVSSAAPSFTPSHHATTLPAKEINVCLSKVLARSPVCLGTLVRVAAVAVPAQRCILHQSCNRPHSDVQERLLSGATWNLVKLRLQIEHGSQDSNGQFKAPDQVP